VRREPTRDDGARVFDGERDARIVSRDVDRLSDDRFLNRVEVVVLIRSEL
jgi:hypothetical protein